MSAFIDPSLHGALKRLARQFMRQLHDDDIEAFAEALDDLPIFDVVRACAEVGKHERYFPRPAIIRRWVQRLRTEQAPRPTTPTTPETYTDPLTGETSQLYTCSACQDRGWVPVTEAGAVISWDAVRGAGDWAGAAITHHHVTRCETCKRLRTPTAPVVRRSIEDEQDDRRR